MVQALFRDAAPAFSFLLLLRSDFSESDFSKAAPACLQSSAKTVFPLFIVT